jgi:hypothetical protein
MPHYHVGYEGIRLFQGPRKLEAQPQRVSIFQVDKTWTGTIWFGLEDPGLGEATHLPNLILEISIPRPYGQEAQVTLYSPLVLEATEDEDRWNFTVKNCEVKSV